MSRIVALAAAAIVVGSASCGDPTDPNREVKSVQIIATPTNPRVGQVVVLGATPLDAAGRAVQGVTCTMDSDDNVVLSVVADGAGWKGTAESTGSAVVSALCGVGYNTVTITVRPPEVTVVITKNGTGTGSVTLNPPGGTYDQNTSVDVTASAASGSTFTRWGGDCAGTSPTCSLVLHSNTAVTATFDLAPDKFVGDAIPTIEMGSVVSGTCTFKQTMSGTLSATITSTNGTLSGSATGTASTNVTGTGSGGCNGASSDLDLTGIVSGTDANVTITASNDTRSLTLVGTRSGNTITGTLTIKSALTVTNLATGQQVVTPLQQVIQNYKMTKQ